jgi:hypothetical protein
MRGAPARLPGEPLTDVIVAKIRWLRDRLRIRLDAGLDVKVTASSRMTSVTAPSAGSRGAPDCPRNSRHAASTTSSSRWSHRAPDPQQPGLRVMEGPQGDSASPSSLFCAPSNWRRISGGINGALIEREHCAGCRIVEPVARRAHRVLVSRRGQGWLYASGIYSR